MAVTPPDPKEVIDSIGDTITEILQTGPRFLEKQGALNREIGNDLIAIKEDVKTNMPDKPEVLLRAVVGTAGSKVKLAVGTIGNIATSLSETGAGVRKQVSRVIKE